MSRTQSGFSTQALGISSPRCLMCFSAAYPQEPRPEFQDFRMMDVRLNEMRHPAQPVTYETEMLSDAVSPLFVPKW